MVDKTSPDYTDPRDCEIYEIRNKLNNHGYVGSTILGFKNRFKGHKSSIKLNTHKCQHLNRAWNLYGAENFELILLENCGPQTQANRWLCELKWIKTNGYYNAMKASEDGMSFIPSDETRNKQSKSATLERAKPESKERQRKLTLENFKNPETKQKHRTSTKASWKDPEKYANHVAGFRTPEAIENRSVAAGKGWDKRRLDPAKVSILRTEAQKEYQSEIMTAHYADPNKKAATIAKKNKFYEDNPDVKKNIFIKRAKFYKDNPDKAKEFAESTSKGRLQFFKAHPEECDNISERMIQYHKDNPEKVKASQEKAKATNAAIFADPIKKAQRLEKWRTTKTLNQILKSLIALTQSNSPPAKEIMGNSGNP